MKINDSKNAEYKELILLLTEKDINQSNRRGSCKGNGKAYFIHLVFRFFSSFILGKHP